MPLIPIGTRVWVEQDDEAPQEPHGWGIVEDHDEGDRYPYLIRFEENQEPDEFGDYPYSWYRERSVMLESRVKPIPYVPRNKRRR